MANVWYVLGNWTTYIIHFTLKLKRNGHIHILDGSVSWPQKAFLYAFNFFNNENFLLDICSQQLGEKMSVEYIFWYLIYHANTSWSWSVGEYNLVEIYICIEYILPTIWGIYVSLIYILVGYIMQTVGGMNVSWVVSVRPSGAELGNIYISKYIFVLDICSKRFWENM